MAVHPLRSTRDRCLGKPLPYQLANPTLAHPLAVFFYTLIPLLLFEIIAILFLINFYKNIKIN